MTTRNPPPGLPGAPVDLMAVAIDCCQVILAWTECGAGGLGFRIERAEGIGSDRPFSEIGRTGANVLAFSDGSAKPRTNYAYRIRAMNSAGDSLPSNAVELTTPRAGTGLPYVDE